MNKEYPYKPKPLLFFCVGAFSYWGTYLANRGDDFEIPFTFISFEAPTSQYLWWGAAILCGLVSILGLFFSLIASIEKHKLVITDDAITFPRTLRHPQKTIFFKDIISVEEIKFLSSRTLIVKSLSNQATIYNYALKKLKDYNEIRKIILDKAPPKALDLI